MQNIILAIVVFLVTSAGTLAQCDKKIKWTAANAELLDKVGNVIDTKSGTISIVTDNKSISINIIENDGDKLEATITESTCEWKEAFKNGKSFFKGSAVDKSAEPTPATFTIEGKDGKLVMIVELEKMEGKKVRVFIDKYETL